MSKKSVIGTTSVGILSSVLAFLGVVSCCGLPIIAGALAWLGIGASQLSFFAEYRPIFIGIAIVALLFGFWQVYFKKKSSCCSTTSCCGTSDSQKEALKSKSKTFQKIFLWIGAIVIALMLILGEQNAPAQQTNDAIAPQIQLQDQPSGCCPGEPAIKAVEETQGQASGCCPSEAAKAPVEENKSQTSGSCCPQN